MELNINGYPLPGWLNSIHHDGSEKYVSNLTPGLGQRVRIRVRTGLDAPVDRIYLRTYPDGEQHFAEMAASQTDQAAHWWEIELAIDQPSVHYRFVLLSKAGIFWYSAAGISIYDPLDIYDFQILADYLPPAWVHSAVFYQIFPDRFANGDPENDPAPEDFEYRGFQPTTYPWGFPPDPDQPFPIVFYGGDLNGITQRLDYLQDLGINALYLNPIFSARSNHKYDVIDYEHVDEHFGGDQALIELKQGLADRHMRYILDIVPNHTGFWHPWFQAARQDPAAPENQFFTFSQHPDRYATWLGVWSLPKLNYASQELQARVFGNEDAFFRRWLRPPFSADGWRVDVANMLGRQGANQQGSHIARSIRQAVKVTRPDAYLIGENFFDATEQLQGDQWDGVMNYMGLTMPLWHWLRGFRQGAWGLKSEITSSSPWPTAALASTWRTRRAAIPWVIALQQFNLLDSHDTARIRTIVGGNEALHRLATIVQFTFPGVPCIYYGDELGLPDDPQLASRGCMPWEPQQWDLDFRAFYQQLIQFRRASEVLQLGGFQMILEEQDTFAYQRETLTERVLVIAHRDTSPRPPLPLGVRHAGIQDGTRFRELFSGHTLEVQNGALPLGALPQGATLWIQI